MGRASLPDDLKARVLSAARQEPSPTRGAAIAADTIVLAATAAAVLNLLLASGGIYTRQTSDRWYVPAAWAVVAVAATWIAFGRGKSMLGRRRSVLLAASASAVIACIGIASMGSSWARTSGSVMRALLIGTLASTTILAAFIYARRGSELRHPRAAGAALGAASAAWAALLVELNQPAGAFVPAVVAHLSPMLVAIALGYLVGGRLIVGRAS